MKQVDVNKGTPRARTPINRDREACDDGWRSQAEGTIQHQAVGIASYGGLAII